METRLTSQEAISPPASDRRQGEGNTNRRRQSAGEHGKGEKWQVDGEENVLDTQNTIFFVLCSVAVNIPSRASRLLESPMMVEHGLTAEFLPVTLKLLFKNGSEKLKQSIL